MKRTPLARHAAILLLAAMGGSASAAPTEQQWAQLRNETFAHLQGGSPAKAVESAKALLAMSEQMGPLPRNLARIDFSSSFLVDAYAPAGRDADALAVRLHLLKLQEQYLGADHPDLCLNLNNLGTLYTRFGRQKEAEAAFERVLAIKEKHDPKHVTAPLTKLANHYRAEKKYPQAETAYLKLLDIYERNEGKNSPRQKPVLGYLAETYRDMGRKDQAALYTARAAKIPD
jgi:tetratricopeptide (TPR) repeat protein